MQPSSSSAKQPRNNPIPWIGTTILVLKVGHPMKGYQEIIKSVLCKQPMESGLRVVAQLTHLDPSSPYKMVVLNYDNVVEAQYVDFGYLSCVLSEYMIVIDSDASSLTLGCHKASSLFLLIEIIQKCKCPNTLLPQVQNPNALLPQAQAI